MADTTFNAGTVITSPWLNDINDAVYQQTSGLAGAIPRSLTSKLGDVVSILDFGAVMNSSAAEVRTANSAALTAALAVNRTVYIPAGTLWISANTSLPGFWNIIGAGAESTFIKGDGDLFSVSTSDNGEMRRMEHLTILNDATRGKLFKNVGTTNRVEFDHVNFMKATYHIHSSGGDAVSWKLSDCRFIDASIESRHFEGLWVHSEVACYTWFSTIGLRCTNGNVSTISIDGTFEQMDDSAIVLDASDAAYEIAAVWIHAHFEVNGKTTNAADVAILTSAVTRARAIKLETCGFFTPTATQTVRVSVAAGGGGNIDFIEIDGGALMGNVALCTNTSSIKVRNVYFQSLTTPTGTITPVQVTQSLNNKYLGSESIVGISDGSSGTIATGSAIPSGTKMATISVQGNIYNGGANTHTGYLEARYFASGARIAILNDVNHSAGANQGFIATVSGGAIVITNKAAMTNNQSGDVVISYWA